MSKALVIVESPTKERTLKKYLGSQYKVASTVGHIKDLPQKEFGIDVENGFSPNYVTVPGKQKVIKALKSAAQDVDAVYLAPDPDREGEAIAWHTADILQKKEAPRFYRVLFHELTKKGVEQALANTETLNENKYKAQQTRRILDRLVGYEISPILWKKVKYGLSAGRVQSVAVRMICEREREIQAFEPEEYWTITAHLQGENPPAFAAKLAKKNGQKIRVANQEQAAAVLEEVRQADFIVDKIVKKTVKRNPYPPFITSKLQQDAIRRLRFSAKKTMTVAQQLYEGVDLGHGEYVGLITYMRTDSTRISAEAANEALELIRHTYGADYALDKPRFFKNKNKAQDAHEAIRPTSVYNSPDKVAPYLSKDQLALYRLIWQRFVASQMAQALIDQQSISINAGAYLFAASGSSVRFPGFLALYQSSEEEGTAGKKTGDKEELPELAEGMKLSVREIEPRQHFTVPPPRYSEASLVKAMEENGIGRPSTYAAILSNIQDKGYVSLEKGHFYPSELGCIVSDLLVENFPDIFSVDFTAQMETDLDRVEAAEADALDVLNRFYQVFESRVSKASDHMHSVKGVGVPTDLNCPSCGRRLHIKVGKNGPFLACEGYPECTYSRNYSRDEKGRIYPIEPSHEAAEGQLCDKCGRQMVVKQGRYGDFLACSGYPECKNTRSINGGGKNAPSTGVACPQSGCDGELVQRKSKRGKVFYGCSRFPDCTYALWDKPVPKACPQCGASFLVEKTTKKEGTILRCANPECGYKESGEENG
ncbi:MAG TPA: type I DNA topoisomerase [Desulfosalsimonadaceae bacterium]|nr:type I DNA topoisomerase [Desulfosalsimonadaceae bacterium]